MHAGGGIYAGGGRPGFPLFLPPKPQAVCWGSALHVPFHCGYTDLNPNKHAGHSRARSMAVLTTPSYLNTDQTWNSCPDTANPT